MFYLFARVKERRRQSAYAYSAYMYEYAHCIWCTFRSTIFVVYLFLFFEVLLLLVSKEGKG